jgi:bifunctional non-homologous end joining protein LigD
MFMAPMLCTSVDAPPDDPKYVAERKLDGWRAIAGIDGDGKAWLETRTGARITQVPYITALLGNLAPNTVLDGEIVDLSGGREWNRVQSILGSDAVHEPGGARHGGDALTYVVFDVLALAGVDRREEPWECRRELLEFILDPEAWCATRSAPASTTVAGRLSSATCWPAAPREPCSRTARHRMSAAGAATRG